MKIVKMDFIRDYVELCRTQLEDNGFKTTSLDPGKIIFAFLNFQKRKVLQVKRKILKSVQFSCPDRHKNGLNNIEQLIIGGGDLTPFLSKNINKLEYNDSMLNDWGIHHFHLGEEIGFDNFSTRSGCLLFVYFDSEFTYFIGIYDHKSWYKNELMEVMHDNWPEAIINFKENSNPSQIYTDEEIKAIREKGGNVLLTMKDGTIYFPVGGGQTSNQSSAMILFKKDFMIYKIKKFEEEIANQIQFIRNDSAIMNITIPQFPEFILVLRGEDFFAVETVSRIEIPLRVQEYGNG